MQGNATLREKPQPKRALPTIPATPETARGLLREVERRALAERLDLAARELSGRDAALDVLRHDSPVARSRRGRGGLAGLFRPARPPASDEAWDSEQLATSGLFLVGWYRWQYAGRIGGGDPWSHYLDVGLAAGLAPNPFFDPAWYAANHLGGRSDEPSILHYGRIGARYALAPGPLFDSLAYLMRHEDAHGEPDPLAHFLVRGIDEGKLPIPVRP